MRVLVISAAFPPLRGGESDHMLHLATRLAERGLDVNVLTVRGSEASSKLPFRVYPIMRDWSWSDLPRLMKFLRSSAPEAILLKYSGWIYNDHPMITFAPTLSKFLLPRSSFITQFGSAGGSVPERHSRAVRAARKVLAMIAGKENVDYSFGTLLRDSDYLVPLGEQHADILTRRAPGAKDKVRVIPPPPILHMVAEESGESRRRGREMLGLAQEDFVVAYFGVVYRSKGLETLLPAFSKIAAKRKDVKLALIGGQASVLDGPSYFQEICDLSRQLGIEDRTVAREYEWDSSDGSFYLRAADVCVLPFDNGVTLNRSSLAGAAAHGLPIITTRGKALESPFKDGRNLLLCEPKDPESLAVAMESVICDRELRRRLCEGASELAQEWFSWDKVIEETISLLRQKN